MKVDKHTAGGNGQRTVAHTKGGGRSGRAPAPDAVALDWPPYGLMHAEHLWNMAARPLPEGFQVDGRPATVADYRQYIATEVQTMAGFLWPYFDLRNRRWVGAAQAHAEALTREDLALMAQLRASHLTAMVKVDEREPGAEKADFRELPATHRALFRKEDHSARPTLELYLHTLTPELLEKVRAAVDQGFKALGLTHLFFKQWFQRPRPYQMAPMLGVPFEYELGETACTPSMISGHSIQGLVVRTFPYMALQRELEDVPNAVIALKQYCVDIGDRRVFAGVHYPSDNISSWYCALRLCDHIFGSRGDLARSFMWDAITKRSHVYQALKATDPAAHPHHHRLLGVLHSLGG